MKIKKIFVIIIFFFLSNIKVLSTEIVNIAIVDNQIITNQDLKNEMELLKILNNQNINEEFLKKTSINNLIDYYLKSKEVRNNNIKINISAVNEDYNKIITKISNKNFTNVYKNLLFERIKTEFGWNQLIMSIYGTNLNVNLDEIEKKIKQMKIKNNKINTNIELDKLILQEKNKKINVFSAIYLKKIKNKSLIKFF